MNPTLAWLWLDSAPLLCMLTANIAATRRQCHCNMSRGDKTAIELFIAGIQGWEAGMRRTFAEKPEGESQL